jgi:hypothetical protein
MGELIFGIILLVAAFFVRLAASFVKTDSGRPIGGLVKIVSLGMAVVGVFVVLGATAVVINPGEVGVQHAFGSVTTQDIADAIKEARGLSVDRRRVHLDDAIKNIGTYMVVVEVANGVTATVKTMVNAE